MKIRIGQPERKHQRAHARRTSRNRFSRNAKQTGKEQRHDAGDEQYDRDAANRRSAIHRLS